MTIFYKDLLMSSFCDVHLLTITRLLHHKSRTFLQSINHQKQGQTEVVSQCIINVSKRANKANSRPKLLRTLLAIEQKFISLVSFLTF